jgi:ubiquinone/menaquinone biosynthesis C-methylase UbiE
VINKTANLLKNERYLGEIAVHFSKVLKRFIKHYDNEYVIQIFSRLSTNLHPLTLDIGCGEGETISNFRSQASDVFGLDISVKNARKARERDVNIVVGDAHFLPFVNSAFDAVICIHVIEHLRSSSKALSEMHRILKAKGFLLLATPNRKRIASVLLSPFIRLVKGNVTNYPLNPNHIFEFTDKDLALLLKRSFVNYCIIPSFIGFKIASLNWEIKLPKILKSYCDRLIALAIK